MNKITPEEVVEAYRKLGIKPVFGIWGRQEGGECGCALTAMVANKVGFNTALNGIYGQSYTFIRDTLQDYDEDYLYGFVHGFDYASEHPDRGNNYYRTGFYDGVATRKAVEDAFGVMKK